MSSVEREFFARQELLDRIEKYATLLGRCKKPPRNPEVGRLVDSLFELWSLDTQGIPLKDRTWSPKMYREAIKNWWGEEESHDVITQAIEEVIVTTCQEQGLEMTYQMVDWLRNEMGYEF